MGDTTENATSPLTIESLARAIIECRCQSWHEVANAVMTGSDGSIIRSWKDVSEFGKRVVRREAQLLFERIMR